jgi:5'-deoxynucleotidase YfbR-like HD superfamily hydrolase
MHHLFKDLVMLTIRDKLRASSVNRWHTLGNINRTQNIAEHSFSMALLADDLLRRLYKSINAFPSTDELYLVMRYSLVHDLPEVLTGDGPSPYKVFLSKHAANFSELLKKVEFQCVPELAELDDAFRKHPLLGVVCKACDCIEAYHFISINGNISGDQDHIKIVQNKLLQAIMKVKKKGLIINPNLDWSEVDNLIEDMLSGGSALIDFEQHGGLLDQVTETIKNKAKTT